MKGPSPQKFTYDKAHTIHTYEQLSSHFKVENNLECKYNPIDS